jgi:hypothetical protein
MTQIDRIIRPGGYRLVEKDDACQKHEAVGLIRSGPQPL